ncbi:MAG: hypothetical protein NTY13_02815 [Chlamydiae bacterium]|nr:hypothetical protein [Chlamydiota bacterium]
MDEILILMHRDVHFSGSFSAMLEYYLRDGVGVIDEIDIEEILHLKILEEQSSPLSLGPEEKRRVLEAKEAYKKVQALYQNSQTTLLADLILEEEEKLDNFTEAHLPWLIDLLHNSDFSDPLYPGYGLAPIRSAKVLGVLQKELGTKALFERLLYIGNEEVYLQEEILVALRYAKDFLVRRVQSRPVNQETLAAAMALGSMEIDEELITIVKREYERLLKEGCRDSLLLQYLEALYS